MLYSESYAPDSFDIFIIGILSYLLTDVADVDVDGVVFADIFFFPGKLEKLTFGINFLRMKNK